MNTIVNFKMVLAFGKVLLCLCSLAAISLWIWWPVEVYRKFDSPDGRHTLVVYRSPLLIAFPGGGGDAPGTVVLQDANGTELNSTPVEMVSSVEHAEWSANGVSVKLLLEWSF